MSIGKGGSLQKLLAIRSHLRQLCPGQNHGQAIVLLASRKSITAKQARRILYSLEGRTERRIGYWKACANRSEALLSNLALIHSDVRFELTDKGRKQIGGAK